jgi:hypothetical protein
MLSSIGRTEGQDYVAVQKEGYWLMPPPPPPPQIGGYWMLSFIERTVLGISYVILPNWMHSTTDRTGYWILSSMDRTG